MNAAVLFVAFLVTLGLLWDRWCAATHWRDRALTAEWDNDALRGRITRLERRLASARGMQYPICDIGSKTFTPDVASDDWQPPAPGWLREPAEWDHPETRPVLGSEQIWLTPPTVVDLRIPVEVDA